MTDLILKSLDVKNFRSIRGQVHAPLDAKVVVVHGENGSGKTSLLSALELALTGRVQSLERVDPDYEKQLLHRSAVEGSVLLKTLSGTTEQSFKAGLNAGGAHSIVSLDERDATFFRERAFLPQSLLGQLLQIYQDAGNDADSPLAQFVGRLLGLDRLDAIEAGLKPFADVRNVRKNVDGWLAAENEKARLDLLLMDQRKTYGDLNLEVRATFEELVTLCAALELSAKVKEETLDEVASALADGSDSDSFSRLTDQQRRLASIRREIDAALSATKSEVANTSAGSDGASQAFARWQAEYGLRVSALRDRAGGLLPDVSMPSDPAEFAQSVLPRLRTELRQVSERVAQARADIARHAVAQDERNVALRQRDMIESEVARLSTSAGSFGSALAEVTSFITNDICPVCDRDFNEVSKVPLSQHVHLKVMTLSASAERLLTLGRTRSEVQVTIERLDREIEAVATRRIDLEAVADFDRRLASIEALTKEVETLANALREGGRLRAADIAERRVVNEAQARHATLATAHDTLSDFGLSIGAPPIGEGESFQAALARLEALLSARAVRLEERLLRRRNGTDKISTIRSALARRQEVAARISVDSAAWQRADQGLQRAQALRDQGNAIRNAVDRVRSAIVRREFNDRLNRVWRDLFVRLAPTEPFVPAFRIPESFTQRLQPKLITEHWDGGETGGTPGAMLSAGNLNTAALTLFIALHLSVPKDLPWLILDDPVQSMDDVHIAHFAALLRTLSKEHCRQVVIAVHDRQLFEYLKLELSPAFLEDSLLTLELSHGPRRDSVCLSKRFSFKEETAVLAA